MIFMNRFSLSSRATGPKMRVPRGFRWSLMSTTALSSNLMYEPSWRRRSLAVRTTTAFTTSPFFAVPPGMASLTEATMMSPRLAYRRPEPPSTRMHRTSLAPVFSGTLQRVSWWITGLPQFLLRSFDDLDHAPPLGLGQRARLHEPHGVADVGVVALVVCGELGRPAHRLAVRRVPDDLLDAHQHGLVHLLGHDDAGAHLALAARRALGRRGLGRRGRSLRLRRGHLVGRVGRRRRLVGLAHSSSSSGDSRSMPTA